ncbi:hypothetical protein KFL_001880040 [Klebsormidium nitens]|uniref:Alpha/beta hydrolase fold-3 domain-containing protein n=1 Tax=Klebsormidium nitens TaxID=105231 RepID=A0A1Y1I0E5_KLENI|nr:hypothetical protein KFL_001880040 [Klebsormidium nitens]|eukprot:GAQ84410.1 hypothetical protein KFL_001880040 [Klebsormidium nitens]
MQQMLPMQAVFSSLLSLFLRFTTPQPSLVTTFHVPRRLRCCLYYPPSYTTTSKRPYPVYINLHGGGFDAGTPESDGEFCAFLAERADCIVCSPEYRLAPEYPYPAALQDCLAALDWVEQTLQPPRIALEGFSVGGTFALSVAQLQTSKLSSVVAVFPSPMDLSENSVHDFTNKDPMKRNMYHEAYLLSTSRDSLTDPLLSPAYAVRSELPPSVLFIAARFDPNIQDLLKFMEKMKAEKGFIGKVYEDVFHGWVNVPDSLGFFLGAERKEKKWDAFRLIAQEIKKGFYV